MADKTVSGLPASGALTGPELVPIVQTGATVRTTIAAILAKAWDRSAHLGTQAIATIDGLQAALNLKAADADVIHKTGAETKDGVLTLTSAPVVPNSAWTIAKTSGLQTALDAKAVDSTVVKLTGNQTKNGVLTFVDSPIVPTPTTAFQAAPKGFVESLIGASAGLRIEDEGTSVVAAATGINFVGASVSVTDAGSNEATVTIVPTSSPGTAAVATPVGVDDTALINTARAAAGVGGTVVFPPGTYVVSGLTASVANQHWIIMPGATIKTKNASNTPTIDVTANGVIIDGGGTLDGNRANQTDATTGLNSCVRITSRQRVRVQDLTMRDSLSHCVYIDGSSSIRILNNTISGCGPAGNQKQVLLYDLIGNSSDIRICGNTIDSTNPANGCIAITTAVAGRILRKIHIKGNTCIVGDAGATATLGIELFTTGTASILDATVTGNIIEGPSGVVSTDQLYGISIGGTTTSATTGIRNVTVAANVVRNCPFSSIEAVGTNIAVTGNTAIASGALSVNAAASVTGGMDGCTIVGNSLLDSVDLSYAIHLGGGTDGLRGCVVSGNVIRNAAAAAAIYCEGVITGASITGNTITDAAGVAMNLLGTFTDSVIANNVFDLTGVASTVDGILIGSTAVARVGINGNTIKGAGRNGIYGLVATSDISIVGNRITTCDNGLKADAVATRWTVVSNTISNNTDRGLIFATAGVDLAIASNTIHNNPGGNYFTTGSTFLTHVINGAGG